jgi:N-acyl-D-aspartate/D-glutamate deacylase
MLIRGGEIVDGLGGPSRTGDVRVRDGRIVEIGERLDPDGEGDLDASGAIVTPGFVDAHTHLDPWLWRDPSFTPLPQHGVTTVMTGNCSLSLAPVGGDHRALASMFAFIEDVPPEVFNNEIPWTWHSWGEYVQEAGAVPSTVDTAPLVGLSSIRHAIMGEAAYERAADDDERAAIAALARSCLDTGAHGVSLSFIDSDTEGRPVPSRLADDAELMAVFTALVEAGHGIAQFNGTSDHVERIGRICKATGAPATWVQLITYADRPERHRDALAQAARLRAEGANIRPQVSPRPLLFQMKLASTMQFAGLDALNEFINAPVPRKYELARDENWRERARHEWDSDRKTMFPRHQLADIAIVPTDRDSDPSLLPKTLAELHARRGGHPADLFVDWAAEYDMAPGLVVTVANASADLNAEVLCDPNTLVAASDVGAHGQMMAAYGDPTLLLTKHVLERGDLSLERAIQRLTAEPAEFLGLMDRGTLEVGRRADIAIVDLAELEYMPQELAAEKIGGTAHFTRPAKGIRATIAAGEATQIEGVLTGARPGRFIFWPS